MGSFNMAGSMSNLTIGSGDEVTFFILASTEMNYRLPRSKNGILNIPPNTSLMGNEGAGCLLVPRFLPVFGEYNDYGCVENIQENENTKHIEEHFGLPIVEIITGICRGGWDDYPECKNEEAGEELSNLWGMFEHKEVYNRMVAFNKANGGNVYRHGDISDKVLAEVGWVRDEDATGDERYKIGYSHPLLHEYSYQSDGHWTKLVKEDGTRGESLYGIHSLHKWMTNQGLDASALLKYKNICVHEGSIQGALDQEHYAKIANKNLEECYAIPEDEWTEQIRGTYRSALKVAMKSFDSQSPIYQLRSWKSMKYTLETKELQQGLIDLLNFDSMMFNTNNLYFPAMAGPQCGDEKASEALLAVSTELNNTRMSRWDEEEEE